MAFCDVFADSAIARILDHLAKHSGRDFSLTELARESGVSYRTLQRIFPTIVEQQLVRKTRQIGKASMYSLNLESARVKEMHRLHVLPDSPQKEANHIAYT